MQQEENITNKESQCEADVCEQQKMEPYDFVNHPKHYNNYDYEVFEMIERIWGLEVLMIWCEVTAFKYRMRMGTKPGQSIDADLAKERVYLEKHKELKRRLGETIKYTKTI